MVLFRVTEQEHRVLEQRCAAKGGRSLSEFARVELLSPSRYLEIAPLYDALASMEMRMLSLEAQRNELWQRVQALVGTAGATGEPVEEEAFE
jgi:hypothetical protein